MDSECTKLLVMGWSNMLNSSPHCPYFVTYGSNMVQPYRYKIAQLVVFFHSFKKGNHCLDEDLNMATRLPVIVMITCPPYTSIDHMLNELGQKELKARSEQKLSDT